MTSETSRSRLAGIQGLRGVAALMVVLYHLGIRMESLGWERAHFDVMMAGVDIFFVISGFIMWVTTASRPERTALSFLRDRWQRIGPAYWILTATIVATMVLLPSLTRSSAAPSDFVSADNLWHIASSFLFIASPHPIKGDYQPVLTAGWTLNLEMFFYVIFAAAMALSGARLMRRALMILASLAGMAAFGFFSQPTGALAFYTQDLMLEFAGGVIIGIAYSRGWFKPSRLWWLALAGGWAGLVWAINPHFLPRSVEWGVPAILVVAGTVFAPAQSGRLLQKLGDSSYSLYITHQMTLAVAAVGWSMVDLPLNIVFPIVAVTVAIGSAWLFFVLVELPLTRYFDQQRRRETIRAARKAKAGSVVVPLESVVPGLNGPAPGQASPAFSDGHRHV